MAAIEDPEVVAEHSESLIIEAANSRQSTEEASKDDNSDPCPESTEGDLVTQEAEQIPNCHERCQTAQKENDRLKGKLQQQVSKNAKLHLKSSNLEHRAESAERKAVYLLKLKRSPASSSQQSPGPRTQEYYEAELADAQAKIKIAD